MNLRIADICEDDYDAWRPLWDGNNQGHSDEIVTKETWMRLNNNLYPVHGIVAYKNDQLAGLVHYILHPVTGHINPVCYMQDVYVDPAFRKQGIAKAMVEHLASIGQREEWARMYWLAEDHNQAAQALYKNLGIKLNFSLFVLPLN